MLTKVRDDNWYPSVVFGETGRVWRHCAMTLMVAGMLFVSVAQVRAQNEDEKKPFEAAVLDWSVVVHRVTVPINGSITIESTKAVARADVITPAIADVQVLSPKRIMIRGIAHGSTSVVLQGDDGTQIVIEVAVELDLGRLNAAIKRIDPQGNAYARSLVGNIVLSGRVSGAKQAVRIADLAALFVPPKNGLRGYSLQNHLDVAGEQQVLLNVVVAEMNRQAARELNINGFLAGKNFRDGFVVNQLGGLNPANIGVPIGSDATQNMPFVTLNDITLFSASNLSLGFPRAQLQMFIRALADNSLLRIMAEPNLVAISGETATFLAGGEFPIPVPQGNQQITIEFRKFGIRLEFTPVVLGHQRIRLRVAPEVSELDFTTAVQIEGFVVPGLTTRSTETTVELGNGETIAIAGLLSDRVRGIGSRLPGAGDIPIIGSLFRSVQFERSLTELVILVTPEIVAPLDAHQIPPKPGSDMKIPDDFELYMLGMLEGIGSDGVPSENGDETTSPVSQLPSNPGHLAFHGPWGPVLTMDANYEPSRQ